MAPDESVSDRPWDDSDDDTSPISRKRAAEEFLNILFGLWVTSSISAHRMFAAPLGTGGRTPRSCLLKQHDRVSYAVNRFLQPFTVCESVSDDKDRYYT